MLGAFQTNCYVISSPGSRECWIVDCGDGPDEMLTEIERSGREPTALLLTHCHSDHIAGIDEALARFGSLPIYAHEAEARWCGEPALNLSAMLDRPVSVSGPDRLLRGGETLDLCGTRWRVIHTPGHSPGGLTYVHEGSGQAFVGDTLFAGSIGRFDFPTSHVDDLRRSINDVIMGLPDDTSIFPGHGPSTTVGRERATNPYVRHGF